MVEDYLPQKDDTGFPELPRCFREADALGWQPVAACRARSANWQDEPRADLRLALPVAWRRGSFFGEPDLPISYRT